MYKNIGLALLYVAGIILVGLIARFPHNVRVIINLVAIIFVEHFGKATE